MLQLSKYKILSKKEVKTMSINFVDCAVMSLCAFLLVLFYYQDKKSRAPQNEFVHRRNSSWDTCYRFALLSRWDSNNSCSNNSLFFYRTLFMYNEYRGHRKKLRENCEQAAVEQIAE